MKSVWTIAVEGSVCATDRFGKVIRLRRERYKAKLPPFSPVPMRDISTGERLWVQKAALRKAKA